jgi:hypothetical protein
MRFAGAAAVAGVLLAFGTPVALGQNTAPTENKGVTFNPPPSI